MFTFAIIGCGKIAAAHARQIARVGKLVAVVDTVKKKADDFASAYQARCYYGIDDFLDHENEIDIVCVCTPNGCHAEHCIKSLQAGFHVLCEGPLCITTAAAWQMIETEKFCRKKLLVTHTLFNQPAAMDLKKQIGERIAGQTFNFDLNCMAPAHPSGDWRNRIFPGGGALYTHFHRYISLLVFLFGDIEDVKGYTANREHLHLMETEDTGEAVLDMKNGMLGEIHWKLNGKGQANERLLITKIKEPLAIENNMLGSITSADEEAYVKIFDDMLLEVGKKGPAVSVLYDHIRTIAAIEKIYKAVSSNLS